MYVRIPDCQCPWLDELHRIGDSPVLQGEAEGSRRLAGRGDLSLKVTKLHALPYNRAQCQVHQAVDHGQPLPGCVVLYMETGVYLVSP